MAVDYEWRLRVLMAENGMFKAIDLARCASREYGSAGSAEFQRRPTSASGAEAQDAVED
jgi:hypothetical protein